MEQPKIKNPPNIPFVRSKPKIKRNDLCPCGSGKKYKKCCGKKITLSQWNEQKINKRI